MNVRTQIMCLLLLAPAYIFSQGTSCSTPITIPMDSILRNYSVSASTGSNLVCTSSGTSPITYFSITANSAAQPMILKINGPTSQPVEVAFYDGTSCTNGNLETASSICFYDGTGLWSPAEDFVITPNKTYILRIKTATTGSIAIRGYYYTPPNNGCATATTIGTILTFDNNAANKPAAGINPAGVCAVALTNTAIYTYTVDYDGPTSISLENLVCDNHYEGDLLNLGFQLGIFKGTCAGLTSVACHIAVAGTYQFSAGTQTAGTQMYVAINGILGSNCEYSIRAINAILLAVNLKNFNALIAEKINTLKWTSTEEDPGIIYEVERSVDGKIFYSIGTVNGAGIHDEEQSYDYTDNNPPSSCLYRLKIIDNSGKVKYSKVVRVNRLAKNKTALIVNNPVSDNLKLQMKDQSQENLLIKIIDRSGRTVFEQTAKSMNQGAEINISTSKFSAGLYYLILMSPELKESYSFIKN